MLSHFIIWKKRRRNEKGTKKLIFTLATIKEQVLLGVKKIISHYFILLGVF
jgi:heme A synthase